MTREYPDSERSSTGLDVNVAAAVAYLAGLITGIVILLVEKESRFVRFHALQSIWTFAAIWVLLYLTLQVPLLGWLVGLFLLPPLVFLLWIFLIVQAYLGRKIRLPIVGDFAERHA